MTYIYIKKNKQRINTTKLKDSDTFLAYSSFLQYVYFVKFF